MKHLMTILLHFWALMTFRHDGTGLPDRRGGGLGILIAVAVLVAVLRVAITRVVPFEAFVFYVVALIALSWWFPKTRHVAMCLLAVTLCDLFSLLCFLILGRDLGAIWMLLCFAFLAAAVSKMHKRYSL